MEVAELVRTVRCRAGLSTRALAERAGVSYTTVSRIENGHMDPTVTMLSRLLDAAGHRLVLSSAASSRPSLRDHADAWYVDALGRHRPDWTRLRAFVDYLARHPDQVGEAVRIRPEPSGSAFFDNFLAGIAEKVTDDALEPRPAWTDEITPLAEPWASPSTPSKRAISEATTPEQLAARNITMSADSLWRSTPAPR